MPSSEAVPLGLGACRRSGALAGMLALVARLLEWLRSLFWKEEMELTLVGLQYSGKTTLLTVLAVRGRGPAGLGVGWEAAGRRQRPGAGGGCGAEEGSGVWRRARGSATASCPPQQAGGLCPSRPSWRGVPRSRGGGWGPAGAPWAFGSLQGFAPVSYV